MDLEAQLAAAESVSSKLAAQLADLTVERDRLVSEVAQLKAAEVSAERRAALIVSECRIPMLPLGHGGAVKHGKDTSRAEAIEELEAARKESPEAFAEAYGRLGSVIVGS